MQDDSKKTDISIDMDLGSSQQMQLINERVSFVYRLFCNVQLQVNWFK